MNLSIIIPTYNNLDMLKRCISSVEHQLGIDDEVIIVVDGSTDNTVDYLKTTYEHNENFIIKNQKNAGSGEARNNGVINSTREYIWFIDSDDYIEDKSIMKVKEIIEKENFDILYFDYKVKTKKGFEAHKIGLNLLSLNEYLLTQHFPWNKIIKRELMKDVFFPSIKMRFQDHATIPVVVANAINIGYLADALYIYDFSHTSNISKNYKKTDDMYKACDYLIDYHKKGIFSSEEIEILLIKSLIFYKLFDQQNRTFKEIVKDLKKIKNYLDLNVPGWFNSRYLSIGQVKKYTYIIQSAYLKVILAKVLYKNTFLTSLIIVLQMRIKKIVSK